MKGEKCPGKELQKIGKIPANCTFKKRSYYEKLSICPRPFACLKLRQAKPDEC
jgi:hypothetical protein